MQFKFNSAPPGFEARSIMSESPFTLSSNPLPSTIAGMVLKIIS